GLVQGPPGADVLQPGAHEGAALARLDVLELDDVHEVAVEVERHAVLEIIRGRHGFTLSGAVDHFGEHGQRDPTGAKDQVVEGPQGENAALGAGGPGGRPGQ